jgi:ribosomal protein L31
MCLQYMEPYIILRKVSDELAAGSTATTAVVGIEVSSNKHLIFFFLEVNFFLDN